LPKLPGTAKPPKSAKPAPDAGEPSAKSRARNSRVVNPSADAEPAKSAVLAESATPMQAAMPAEFTVPLGADVRIGRARDLYTALIQGAAPDAVVIVDGSEVAKVDAAGLQCVLAAAVRLRTAGAKWRWHNPSPALRSAAQLLGLDGALELT